MDTHFTRAACRYCVDSRRLAVDTENLPYLLVVHVAVLAVWESNTSDLLWSYIISPGGVFYWNWHCGPTPYVSAG